MAQVCHESNGFKITEESLNYKTPERLVEIWPSRFPNIDFARSYIKNPEKLGNYVYANRLGNGPEESGDGFRFRGRGPLQTTGKSWYKSLSLEIFGDQRLVDNPNLLKDLNYGLLAAFLEWTRGKCNSLADLDDLRKITLKINGALTGFEKRKTWLMNWRTVLEQNSGFTKPKGWKSLNILNPDFAVEFIQ